MPAQVRSVDIFERMTRLDAWTGPGTRCAPMADAPGAPGAIAPALTACCGLGGPRPPLRQRCRRYSNRLAELTVRGGAPLSKVISTLTAAVGALVIFA